MDEHAKDLAKQMSIEEIAGLMLYSNHQAVPGPPDGYRKSSYGGKPFAESGAKASDLTDQQKTFLDRDHVRHDSSLLFSLLRMLLYGVITYNVPASNYLWEFP